MTLLTLVHLQASFADHCHIHSTPVARHSWCSTHSAKAWHAILCLLGMQSVRCPQIVEAAPNSYNEGFAQAGGGVWATQFDTAGILCVGFTLPVFHHLLI